MFVICYRNINIIDSTQAGRNAFRRSPHCSKVYSYSARDWMHVVFQLAYNLRTRINWRLLLLIPRLVKANRTLITDYIRSDVSAYTALKPHTKSKFQDNIIAFIVLFVCNISRASHRDILH